MTQTSSHNGTTILTQNNVPANFSSTEELETFMSLPTEALINDMSKLDGDIMILGASGKMGPSLARLAKNAASDKRIIAVARYSDPAAREQLELHGIETIACDMLDRDALEKLPKFKNIIFMAGRKFGSSGDQAATWATNTLMPALVAEIFHQSRIVAFSTGCVYEFVTTDSMGSNENSPLNPPGEYAQSCIGRERLVEYFSQKHQTPGILYRLNYAIDLRYGVLHDVAVKVRDGLPIDVTMGHANVIWQGDANAIALRCLLQATVPTSPLNVTGPETISIRWLAKEFARLMDKKAVITGEEAEKAWLSNATLSNQLFGYPMISLGQMMQWTADWVMAQMPSHNKPTHFEARDGTY
ncbi:NAD-dependent epimerase/dehydratase family protein [Brucellaceae bacterium C25G]